MVNFKLGEKMKMNCSIMTRAWNKENIWVPDWNRTQNPNPRYRLGALTNWAPRSYEHDFSSCEKKAWKNQAWVGFYFPGYITNQFNDQFPVGLLAQLVRGAAPVSQRSGFESRQAWFFQAFFSQLLKLCSYLRWSYLHLLVSLLNNSSSLTIN